MLAIDLLMEPLQVQFGTWRWLSSGLYYGVPIGNFIGWFIVAVIASGIYRVYEYRLSPVKKLMRKESILIPVCCYLATYLSFMIVALKNNMSLPAIIGSLAMAPGILVSVGLFIRWKYRKRGC
ncbi:carotenoid biosynthesis protein [Candidatus Roizmanbacteria bacterium]|nr:carotenoid biosynthesis protein [Candidatus Roizmanbacteria bacterium]